MEGEEVEEGDMVGKVEPEVAGDLVGVGEEEEGVMGEEEGVMEEVAEEGVMEEVEDTLMALKDSRLQECHPVSVERE